MVKSYLNKTVDVLFEEQVKKTPHHIAIVSDEGSITYRGLNERANQIAHYLKSQGIGPEKVVGLHLQRSINAITVILAILKVGGAYLPLNLKEPTNKIEFMLKEGAAKIFITETESVGLTLTGSYKIIYLNTLITTVKNYLSTPLKTTTKVDQLAYLIYTSGSTGQPKGVEIEHKGIPNMVFSQTDLFKINNSSRILAFSSFHFDASISEIFTSLLNGATLFIPTSEIRLDPVALAHYIITKKISTATLPPSYLTLMPSFLHKSFKTLVIAGEACSKKLMDRYKKNCRVINAYGPTEATVCTTAFVYDGIDNRCIGKPISNVQCYVLNKKQRRVVPGGKGELHITGLGLARGYRNQPELTNERFILWDNNGEKIRLYRTGDRVQLLENNMLKYLGRIDFQIKFYGIRLEPEEIETILNQHSHVKQSLITLKRIKGRQYLVAYITVEGEKTLSDEDIRCYLKKTLQPSKIPNVFVFLKKMPLLASGKINRRKLPVPKFEKPQRYNQLQLTQVEKTLKNFWVQVLELKQNVAIRSKSDFFSLGGSSLKAAQLIPLVKKAIGVNLQLPDILENSTLTALANKLRELKSYKSTKEPMVKLHTKDLPLSFAQRRLWLSYQAIKQRSPAAYNLKFLLKFKGILNITKWEETLQCLINRHEILRTYFPTTAIQRVGSFHIDLEHYTISSKTTNLQQAIQESIENVAQYDFGDLSKLPLMRTAIIEINKKEFILALIFHHIIFDEFSVPGLITELVNIYNNTVDKKNILCNPSSVQYSDFVLWQKKMLKLGYYDSAFVYWKKKLFNSATYLNLPVDKRHKGEETFQGNVYIFHIDKNRLEKLNHLSQQKKVSLFTLLFSSIAVLLYRYTNQDDFNIGVAYSHQRNSTLDPLIGFFVNMIPIRIQIENQISFTKLLENIKITLLEAYHHSAPIEEIINQLNLKKSTHSIHPLFQVSVVMHDLPLLNMDFKGLIASLWDRSLITGSNLHTTKFYLNFEMATLETGNLAVKIEYSTDIFFKRSIQRLKKDWIELCDTLIQHPNKNIKNFIPNIILSKPHLLNVKNSNSDFLNTKSLKAYNKENEYITPMKSKKEILIETLWRKVLNLKNKINITDNFFQIGGNSLLAMELNSQINKKIKNVTYSDLFSTPTIQAQAKVLEGAATHLKKSPAITMDYLIKETKLNADIQLPKNVPLAQLNNSKVILLTGATGFLGVYLLVELLNITQTNVYCLIRAENNEKAHLRLLANISQYKINNQINLKRVKAIAGDISDRYLGLSKKNYLKLSHEVDVIYHAASIVNFMQPYSALRATNVLGTKHLLYFAIHHKVKALHYTSSAAVFSFAHHFNANKKLYLEKPVQWDTDLAKALPKDLGYTQTKAVSEKLLCQAHERGLPITIYRVGFILCHSQSGIGNTEQVWSRLIQDCVQLGYYPDFNNIKEEFITVDHAAKSITLISTQLRNIGKIFHIMPKPEYNITTNQLFMMLKTNGKALKPELYEKWLKRLQLFIKAGGSSSLKSMMPLFIEPVQDGLTLLELYKNSPTFSIQNTQNALHDMEKINAKVSPKIASLYLKYLIK
jgi:amino acid adenylation domain-containing protein/thioester reductase-like protein